MCNVGNISKINIFFVWKSSSRTMYTCCIWLLSIMQSMALIVESRSETKYLLFDIIFIWLATIFLFVYYVISDKVTIATNLISIILEIK